MPAPRCPVRAITAGPKHHFFGYYDKFQVDGGGTRMLTLETDFMDRPPTGAEPARIGVVDLARGDRLTLVAETTAWCWQQACMLQWLPNDPSRRIVFNIRRGDEFAACVLDLESGRRRILPRPIYALSPDGRFAVGINFARLAVTRPGYGYPGLRDPWEDADAPAEDGIYHIDLETGASRLIVSLAQIVAFRHAPEMDGTKHWFNHLLVSPDGRRFIFLHRYVRADGRRTTRMFTADPDGGNLFCLNDHEMTSHFIWKDGRTVVAWATRRDRGNHYYAFTDQSDEVRLMAPEKLVTDGHMSYAPTHDWLLTDTYPDQEYRRHLLLYREATDELARPGAFYSDPKVTGEIRCDLHPNWSRDGRLVTFDSIHEGSRQVYLMDVGELVAGGQPEGR